LNKETLAKTRRSAEAKLQHGDQDDHAAIDAVTHQKPKCLLVSVHYLGVGAGMRG